MPHREGTFPGAGGLPLYCQSWHPASQPRAIVAIVHGLGGHSGLFGNLVRHLLPRGYGVCGFDLRGHGRSPGQRGHVDAWAEFREDLAAFLDSIAWEEPGCPCFLLGHSLGAAIVLDYLLDHPTAVGGAIALAPALGPVGISPLKLALGRLLSRVYPRFTLSTGIDLAAGSRDPAVLAAYDRDPLRHSVGTARLAAEFLAAAARIQARGGELAVPLLVLQGGKDRVTPPEGSRHFFEAVRFADKEFKEYPEAYHDLHNDLDYPAVLADLEAWLQRHLDG